MQGLLGTRMNRAGALLAVQAWAGGLGWRAGSEAGEEGRAGFVRISYLVLYGSDYRYSYGSEAGLVQKRGNEEGTAGFYGYRTWHRTVLIPATNPHSFKD